VLGVSPDADESTVRRAYRDRIKEVHPDAEDGDEEVFKRVQEAYEVLTET
jgi:curved DNA-binding protein CbpA